VDSRGVRARPLLGRKPKDWDVTTNATPSRSRLFENTFYTNEFGTVGVVNDDVEDETAQGGRGDPVPRRGQVQRRAPPRQRAFLAKKSRMTLSAATLLSTRWPIATKGELVDLYGRQKDIEARVIRAVGEPNRAFCRGCLRILRAVRIAAELGFAIEPKTRQRWGSAPPQLEKFPKSASATNLCALLTRRSP
jgi:tRNA nucleotidyltransferase (CCA-adding enzyme)